MANLSDEQRNRIIKILEERRATNPCPRCGHPGFALIDGYFNESLQSEISAGFVIGGSSIPSIVLACQNCGFMAQHALGALGLLKSEGSDKQ